MALIILFSSFLLFFFTHLQQIANSLPAPIQCTSIGCKLSYYQGIWLDRLPCKAAKVVYPRTEEELVEAVADAVKKKLKVKVISKGSHSTTKLVCPGGNEGISISTQHYNALIHVNKTAMTVTADAGVQLRELLDKIAQHGLALPHTPYWEEVSITGLVSTGAHGSGLWNKGSATHDYITSIRLVIPAPPEQGFAQVVELNEHDSAMELNAARLSLGVLGAISQLTFALEPMFKRSVTLLVSDDAGLEDEIEKFAKEHEFGGLSWYPSLNKVLFKQDDRVPVDTPGNGEYKLAIINARPVTDIESSRASEEAMQVSKDAQFMCELSKTLFSERISSGDGLLNDGATFHHFPVIGFNHHMQTSGGCQKAASRLEHAPLLTATGIEQADSDCSDHLSYTHTCSWDPSIKGSFFFNTAISVPMSRIKEVIADIKKLNEAYSQAMCGLAVYGGIWMRFISRSNAFLGEKEDAIVFDFIYYRSKKVNSPRFHEDVLEEIEQLLLLKYGGKPHWGKNRDLAFEDMERRVLDLPKFLLVRDRFDPEGVFSSEWSDAILGIKKKQGESRGVQTFRDHCALEGLCICSDDRHCAPEMGYMCREGRVFKTAKVCSYESGTEGIKNAEKEVILTSTS